MSLLVDTKGFIAMSVNALVKSGKDFQAYFPPSKEGRCGIAAYEATNTKIYLHLEG